MYDRMMHINGKTVDIRSYVNLRAAFHSLSRVVVALVTFEEVWDSRQDSQINQRPVQQLTGPTNCTKFDFH